jgi:ectoine hydroxylase-related dioxygenase (phytanoyl-CoA dioxygenase family)
MRDQVDERQIAQYREQGFLIIEGFLDADELADWRKQVDEAVYERLESRDQGLHNQGDPDSYYARVFTQCLKLADTHEGMHRLMHDERLGRLAGTLAGVEGIRIWHDQALIKPPFGNPTAWHLDNPYWSFSSRDAISLWVALDDATQANGCMWYLPGTHLTARTDNTGIAEDIAGLFRIYPEWRSIEPMCAACPAGSAVLHNGLTAHGAGANMTNRPRRAMTCAYMPDGSTFNGIQNVLPADYFATLSVGDPLDDPAVNPLIWSKA